MADFETTTVADDCRVWGWGIVQIPDDWQSLAVEQVEVGTSLDDFIDRVADENLVCYFHNLRFDGRFIIDWLLKNGYQHQEGPGGVQAGGFKTLISDMGAFYSITVKWFSGFSTEFRDSAKKLPMTVKRIAESFKMEQSKGDIDYEAPRPVGYHPTDDEVDYIRRDVWIVARAVGQQISQGMHKLTVGADALAEFKNIIGKNQFDRLFPVLSFAMDSEIRRAYRGGFTYADPRYKGRQLGAGKVFDVNSLYPSVMYTQPIPYGEPQFVAGKVMPTKSHPLTIFAITFTAKLKPDYIPTVQIKHNMMFQATEYLHDIDEPVTLMMTNVDYALMCDHYDVDVLAWEGGWRFKAALNVFDPYIDKYMKIKANSSGGIREISKLFLNSLYGKYATRPDVTGKVPYLDENGTVRLRRGMDEVRNPVYTAAGVFITSYARDVTIRAAQANFDAFAYADTDSLHLLRSDIPDTLDVHPSNLGAWKHELDFDAAWYIRAKAYLEYGRSIGKTGEPEGERGFHNAVAGIPTHISAALTFDDLVAGTHVGVEKGGIVRRWSEWPQSAGSVYVHGKLNPKAVPGGVVLADVPYELKLE